MSSSFLRSNPVAIVLLLAAFAVLSPSIGAAESLGSCTLKAKAGRRVLIGYVWTREVLEAEGVTESACRSFAEELVQESLDCVISYGSSGDAWDDYGSQLIRCPIRRVKWKFHSADGEARGAIRRRG